MENPETVSEVFVQWLEQNDIATFGQDLYINEVPSSQNTLESVYWINTSGGNPISKNKTGEIIRFHSINVYYRSTSGKDVERKLFELAELIQNQRCFQLTGFETIDVSVAQFPATSDMDVEDRKIGFLRLNIQTYKRSA